MAPHQHDEEMPKPDLLIDPTGKSPEVYISETIIEPIRRADLDSAVYAEVDDGGIDVLIEADNPLNQDPSIPWPASDAGPAATPRPEGQADPLDQAVERTSRHAPTPKP